MTIAELARSRDNNFTLLRFVAAASVIVGHSFAIATGPGGMHDPVSRFLIHSLGISLPDLAVRAFFVISGFLVTGSFVKRRNLVAFAEARFLRLFPGLLVCVLFTVFVVGLWATTLPPGKYLTHAAVWKYVIHNSSLIDIRFRLPGVFMDNIWPGGVNGSLWTLPVELLMYCWVAVLGIAGILRHRVAFHLFMIIALLLFLQVRDPAEFFLAGGAAQNVRYAAMFGLGAILFVNARSIHLNYPVLSVLGAAAAVLHGTHYFDFAFNVLFAYLMLFLAYHPSCRAPSLDKLGDFSYGLYIYAFPVQQSISHLFPGISPWMLLAGAFPATLTLAVISWFAVERPALALKGRLRFGRRAADPRVREGQPP